MSPEAPNNQADERLRRYAEKRRADGGQFSLHPATRRLLQGEVARHYKEKARHASGPRSFYAWLGAWRMPAAACGVLAVLALGVWYFWRGQGGDNAMELARLNDSEVRVAAPVPLEKAAAEKRSAETPALASKPADKKLGETLAPATPLNAPVPPAPAPAAVPAPKYVRDESLAALPKSTTGTETTRARQVIEKQAALAKDAPFGSRDDGAVNRGFGGGEGGGLGGVQQQQTLAGNFTPMAPARRASADEAVKAKSAVQSKSGGTTESLAAMQPGAVQSNPEVLTLQQDQPRGASQVQSRYGLAGPQGGAERQDKDSLEASHEQAPAFGRPPTTPASPLPQQLADANLGRFYKADPRLSGSAAPVAQKTELSVASSGIATLPADTLARNSEWKELNGEAKGLQVYASNGTTDAYSTQSNQVLGRFTVEQLGDSIRLVGADSSVYTGVITNETNERPAVLAANSQRSLVESETLAESRVLARTLRFRAMGTNKTLGQPVIIRAELRAAGEGPVALRRARSEDAVKQREVAQIVPGAASIPTLVPVKPAAVKEPVTMTNALIQGTFRIGTGAESPFRAVRLTAPSKQ